jgi:hypothetical protein
MLSAWSPAWTFPVLGYGRDVVSGRFLIGSARRQRATNAFFVPFSRFFAISTASGPGVCSGTGKESTRITAREYVRRPVDYGEYEYSEGKVKSLQQQGIVRVYVQRKPAYQGGTHLRKLSP